MGHEVNFCSSFNWSKGLLNFIGLASTELSFCCNTSYDFLAPKRAIKEDVVINKQDLIEDNLFHLNEAFQLINSREKI